MPYLNIGTENVRYISLGLCIAALIVSFIVVGIVVINRKYDRTECYYLGLLAISNTVLAAAYVIELVITGEPGRGVYYCMYGVCFLEFAIPYVLALILTYYILYLIEAYGGWSEHRRGFAVVYFVWALIVVAGSVSHQFFYIDEYNVYQRGPLYLIPQALGFVLLLTNAVLLKKRGQHILKTAYMAIMTFIVVPIIAVLFQSVVQGSNIFPLATTLCALMMVTFIQMRQSLEYSQSEKELAELKITMLLSQMRPHFLYNALSSISQLCKRNPKRASEMTDRFAEFLRKNMNDVTKKELIPFKEELTHIQNYISIEQMRFGDIIRVDYDIQTVDFGIPALVLQPVVENAIRHGLREREDGGTIRITTRQVGKSCVLTVSDDGVGFNVRNLDHPADGKVHLGVSSVRKRIDTTPGASFSITSTPGVGTTAVFVLPRMHKK